MAAGLDGATVPFALDRARLRQALQRAAANPAGYAAAAFLYQEVGERLLERLDWLRLRPETVLVAGGSAGPVTALLLKKYRKARVIAVELAPALVAQAQRHVPWWRTLAGAVAELEALPLATASCDLIFSNLLLPWSLEPERAFAEFRRVLKPGGALLFSTLGPDSLSELRAAWATVDDYNHINAFFDMHDLGDALLRARLAEPVMDVERLTLTYRDLTGLMRDLRAAGVGNVTAGRARGLTGKERWRKLRAAYDNRRVDGVLPVSCEVVYGHAWGPQPGADRPPATGPAVFPLANLRRRLPQA